MGFGNGGTTNVAERPDEGKESIEDLNTAHQHAGSLDQDSEENHDEQQPAQETIPATPSHNTGPRNGPTSPILPSLKPVQELRDKGSSHREGSGSGPRPPLQSTPTTAISRTDIHTQSYQNGTREFFAVSPQTPPSTKTPRNYGSLRRLKGLGGSEAGDTASIRSYAPTSDGGGDTESLIGDVFGAGGSNQMWKLFGSHVGSLETGETALLQEDQSLTDFQHEFEDVLPIEHTDGEEKHLIARWRAKRKHFMILSSAGKPIYSRHGDDNLISSTMGTIQTIISFFEGAQNQLQSFKTADARFVIMTQGPLYLVAISKLQESVAQLRAQLEALYMQILSTLTLPTLTTLFANRPSTDLRRPLKGTEVLLSSLADSFTRGSPSALLSSLECLRLRKIHRKAIDDALLRTRSSNLLYGLVVAGGRLVSVVRPRKHSLHAGDLQLIFNMLFEADGVKAGGGENWIPLCLPGFNKNGYLYMYASFVPVALEGVQASNDSNDNHEESSDEIVILLISSNKESFYELRQMRDDLMAELEKTGSIALIKEVLRSGRPTTTDIVPGTVINHFLYKSRSHVQYVMPSYEPHYTNILTRRRLLSTYHSLQASVHAKHAHLHVQHCLSRSSVSLAWVNPLFELYCVAGPRASRTALAQSANKIVQWARREEERIFIIGGGIF